MPIWQRLRSLSFLQGDGFKTKSWGVKDKTNFSIFFLFLEMSLALDYSSLIFALHSSVLSIAVVISPFSVGTQLTAHVKIDRYRIRYFFPLESLAGVQNTLRSPFFFAATDTTKKMVEGKILKHGSISATAIFRRFLLFFFALRSVLLLKVMQTDICTTEQQQNWSHVLLKKKKNAVHYISFCD